MENSRRIDKTNALRLVLNVASALEYLYRSNLVHRDIKPGNILISGGNARLADFGLVKSLEMVTSDQSEHATEELAYAAMPRMYRTPELVRRANGDKTPLTTASDIYQLGTILYELISGTNPQSYPTELTENIHLSFREIPGEQGKQILDLAKKMLNEDPTSRPSAVEVRSELLKIHQNYCAKYKEMTGQFV